MTSDTPPAGARPRWRISLRDPLVWIVGASAMVTFAIAWLLVATLGPGVEEMSATTPGGSRLSDLRRRLTQAEAESQAAAERANAAAAAAAATPAPVAEPPRSDWRVPPVRDAQQGEEDAEVRQAIGPGENPRRSLKRQIKELEHLKKALDRERKQLERADRWDPQGHRQRQMRMSDIYYELERVEEDIDRLDELLDRID